MRKSAMAIFVVILMLVVPFTGCSISGENAIHDDDESVDDNIDVIEENEQIEDVRSEESNEDSNTFYDDGNGMLWMFRPMGEDSAIITGGYNYGSVTKMNVPGNVQDNAYLNASISIKFEKNVLGKENNDYAVVELKTKESGATDYSIRYLNIHFCEGDSQSIAFGNLSSVAGTSWIELTSGKTITITGVENISVIDSYHCDSDRKPTVTIITQNEKDVEYVVPPVFNINKAEFKIESRDNSIKYNVESVDSHAFDNSINSKVLTFIGVNGGGFQPFDSGKIRKISITNTIESIGDCAFQGFSGLNEVIFEQNSKLKTIGIKAFQNCGNSKLYEKEEGDEEKIVDKVEISENNIPESIACGETLKITIIIKNEPTAGKDNGIYLYHGNKNSKPSSNNVLLKGEFKEFTNNNGVYSCDYPFDIGSCSKTSHQYYVYIGKNIVGNNNAIKIPIKVGMSGPDYLTVVIPSSVEYIGDSAFNNVQKLSFQSGSKLKYLGSNAFQKLNFPVEFPDTIENFGDRPFNYCPGISFANGKYSDGYVVRNGELISYFGNEGKIEAADFTEHQIKLVRGYAFNGNPNVVSVEVPDGIEWGLFPFYGCTSLKEVELSRISDVPDYLFGYSGLENVIIPANIVSIGQKSFYSIDSLTSVTVSDENELVMIGQNAFSFNKNLKTVILGSSRDGCYCTVDDYAFFSCNSLESVTLSGFCLQEIGKAAFAKFDRDTQTTGNYRTISFGSGSVFTIPSEVKTIGDYAFAYVKSRISSDDEPGKNIVTTSLIAYEQVADITGIVFSQGSQIVSIGEGAFSRIKGIESLDLSGCDNLESIGLGAFRSSTLKDIKLPDSGNLKQVLGFNSDVNGGLIDSLTVPKYVEEAGYLSIFKEVSFEEGSELRSFRCDRGCYSSSGSTLTDLSNCRKLQSVAYIGDIILPDGVYSIRADGSGTIKNEDKLAIVTEKITISENTSIINSRWIGNKVIEVDPTNPYFRMDDGCLVYINGSEKVIIGVSLGVTSVDVSEGSDITGIADGAFKGAVNKLVIGKAGLSIGERIFEGSTADTVNVIILIDSARFSRDSFEGDYSRICFYVGTNVDRDSISSLGDVYVGVSMDGRYVFFPEDAINLENSEIVEFEIEDIDQQGHVRIGMTGGYTQYDLMFIAGSKGTVPAIDREHLDLSGIDFGDSRYVMVDITFKPRQTEDNVTVIFDGNGGSLSGESQRMKMVGRGLTLIDSDFPAFKRVNSDLIGWTIESGDDYDADSVLSGDLYLYAKWQNRNPVITIGTDAGDVICNGVKISSIQLVPGSSVVLSFSAFEGYDVRNWVIDGVESETSALNDLVLDDIQEDCRISVTYRYYSPSSGLNPIISKGLPTAENIGQAVKAWEAGGNVDMSGAVWTGHASVPLIVDDYVYTRVGNNIYKIESDTGYVVGLAPSKSAETFYHQLGYGNGLIVDALTGYVYDTDLQLKFTVNGSFTGVEYYDGYFYTSGTTLYKFSADSSDASASGTMTLSYVGTFDKSVYSSYGFSSSVFENGYVYRVFAQGNSRGITAMNIDDKSEEYGRSSSVSLNAISSMYLDDGWISYYNGVLYLPGYTQGLFGAIATTGDSALSYVKVNGLKFLEQGSYVFEGSKTFVSEFVVSDGYGFINAGGMMYVFKMNEDGTPSDGPVTTCSSTGTHGSFTLDKSYATEYNGHLTYFYLIPYRTANYEVVVLSGHEVDGGYEMIRTVSNNFLNNYNSQAVRADNEGRMVWYNDSGQVYSFTTPDKNRFFFFIDDGTSAQWYESYGASSAEALELLGSDVVTLSKSDSLLTVNGNTVGDNWKIYYLKRTIRDFQGDSDTGWIGIDNLYDRSLDVYHYYVITNSAVPVSGVEFTYISGDSTDTYSFADNIGDRSVVGKAMVKGTGNINTIRFFNDGQEIEGSALIGIEGSAVSGSFPSVVRVGYSGYWVLRGTETEVDSLPSIFDGDVSYEIRWIELSYEVEVKTSVSGGQIYFNIAVERSSGEEDLMNAHLFIIAEYEGHKYLNGTSNKLDFGDGGLTMGWSVSTDGLVKVRIMVVKGMPSVGSFTNYGMYTYIHE